MTKDLPYQIWAFGAMIATFNSFSDAADFAESNSTKYPSGWTEIRDGKRIAAAFSKGVDITTTIRALA